MTSHRFAAIAVILAVGIAVGDGRAATLDVVDDAADLVFTWDTGPDDLLRGTTPDNLQPWLTAVSSPLRVPGENALRGEHAYYRLASGSNMAFRVERTFDPPSRTDERLRLPFATLAERRGFSTASALLDRWPTLVEVLWFDAAQLRYESVARLSDGTLLGDLEDLPRHGGVWLNFSATTTVTIVGSADDGYPGMGASEFGYSGQVLAVPLDSRRTRAVDIFCGDPGIDWFDVDGDGWPDECGQDTDGDGRPDTGLFGPNTAGITSAGCSLLHPDGTTLYVFYNALNRRYSFNLTGQPDPAISPGGAYLLTFFSNPSLNLPFRPPRW